MQRSGYCLVLKQLSDKSGISPHTALCHQPDDLVANGFSLFVPFLLCFSVNMKISSDQIVNSEYLDLVLLPTTKQNKLGRIAPWSGEEVFVLSFVFIIFIYSFTCGKDALVP